MKSDKSRETFVPTKHYSGVRLQQGRVLTDADWNEQSDVIEHRDETTSLDVIGPSGAPVGAPGFTISSGTFQSGVADLNISAGRMYVDGILCEIEDPITYSNQPDPVYDPSLHTPPTIPTGLVLVYLDVWERHIGVVEDPQIREVALGGPDTATRAKTVWQVKTVFVDTANGETPASTLEGLQIPVDEQGHLAARAQPTTAATDPCIIPQAAGFRSLENQLYRVEVHTPGALQPAHDGSNGAFPPVGPPAPTFKWSRDNGSVVAAWINDPQPLPNTLKVQLLTNDPTRGFSVGDWVELTDDRLDLSGFGGTFLQVTQVDGDVLTYSTDSGKIIGFPGLPAVPPITRPLDSFHPKVRRWDMPANSSGPQPIVRNATDPTSEPEGMFIDLENGVQIQFEAGTYRTGDYWMIPARTATGGIEWPAMTSAADSPPAQLPPFGIQHHLACLATFNLSSSGFGTAPDTSCRKVFSPLTDLNPVTPDNTPKPGEWRYYLVDGTQVVGDDSQGKVGISNLSAQQAYADAIPFATLNAAMLQFPRDGNDSTAVIMLESIDALTNPYDDLILQGLHGYRKVLIRGSVFINQDNDQKVPQLDDSDWINLGAIGTGPFLVSGQTASAGNVINVSLSTQIGVATDALVGQRLRFLSDSSLPDFASMVLGNGTLSNGADVLTIGDPLPSIPGGTDRFVIENPTATIGNVEISAAGGETFFVGHAGEPFPFPSLSLAGLQVQNMLLSGPIVAEIAFCKVTQSVGSGPGSGISLSRFGNVKITPDYSDELGNPRSVGVGVNVDNFIGAVDGDQLRLQNCAGFASEFDDVDDLEIPQGFFTQTAQILDCKRFSIGAELLTVGDPRFIRIGSNLSAGPALQIQNSDGDVLGTAFDIRNIHNESGTPFDFNADDSVDLSAIQFSGTGRTLRLRDVDLTLASTQTSSTSASGILLDATRAVSSIFDYEQRVSVSTVSGLIALPGRSIFRPIELALTDVRDPANNHFLSPGVSSANVAAGAPTLVSGQGRSFIERGIAVQGTTIVNRSEGGPDLTGIPRYRTVQYVGDGTSRVRLARIDLKDIETGASVSPQQIAASFAGVMQHEIQGAEDSKAFGTLISSGYTLVALRETPASSLKMPVAVYLSDSWGIATLVPTTNQFLAVVRIGWLVRIATTGGFGTNMGGGDSIYGLMKIQVDIDGAAPGVPVGD